MENFRVTSRQKIFTFEEERTKSKLTLKNKDEVESVKITVDGGEIKGNKTKKCDFLHLAKDIEMYIELKGEDIKKAIEQIERTINLLSNDKRKQSKRSYIICTRSPLASTEIQNYQRKFKKDFNANLIVRTSPYIDTY
jgi:hypothetical protein